MMAGGVAMDMAMDIEISPLAKISVDPETDFIDKTSLRAVVAELNEQMGIVHDSAATAERARAMMLEDGVRPEDNILTCELIHMRYDEVRE
jgi:hypothetical protein